MQPDRAGLNSTADAGNRSKRRGVQAIRIAILRSSMWPGALKVGVALAGRSSREGVIPSDVSDEHVAGLLEALPTPLKSGADGLW
jgi:hypothetical protein